MANVLVVDDSNVDRTLVEHLLMPTGLNAQFVENGEVAKRAMQECTPDVVITDLMMPELDGLQLVKAIRSNHPEVPVILMTSRGTGETAIEALEAGAASFVPKSQLADRLIDTLHQVLALKSVDHPYRELLECLNELSTRFCLRSELSLIPQLVDLVQRMLSSVRVCDPTESIRLSLALEEGLLNALWHGSLELTSETRKCGFASNADAFKTRSQEPPFRDRKILVQIEISSRQAKFVIKDEGPGFDTSAIPSTDDLGPFANEFGRGLRLMNSFMDKVRYNDSGNELTLVRLFGD